MRRGCPLGPESAWPRIAPTRGEDVDAPPRTAEESASLSRIGPSPSNLRRSRAPRQTRLPRLRVHERHQPATSLRYAAFRCTRPNGYVQSQPPLTEGRPPIATSGQVRLGHKCGRGRWKGSRHVSCVHGGRCGTTVTELACGVREYKPSGGRRGHRSGVGLVRDRWVGCGSGPGDEAATRAGRVAGWVSGLRSSSGLSLGWVRRMSGVSSVALLYGRWVTAAGVAFVGPGRGRWSGTAGNPVGVIGGKLAAGEARQRRVGRERGSRTPGTTVPR